MSRMQIVVLLGFVVALVLWKTPPLAAQGWWTAAAPGAYLLIVAATAWWKTAFATGNIEQGREIPPGVLRRYGVMNILGQVWMVGGLAGVIVTGYGAWLASGLHLDRVPLVGELATLAPFVAALLLNWAIEYPFHRVMRKRIADIERRDGIAGPKIWSRAQYVTYNVRHHLLFIAVPVCLIIAVTDALALWVGPYMGDSVPANLLMTGMTVFAVAAIFFFAPLMIVRIWRTRRLEDGALRDELEKMCRSLHLGYRELLVWESGGVIANAGVMGLAAPVRYILLSDGLLEGMDPRQVKAVFAHEAGHIAEHHIFYSVLFAIAAATFCMYAGLLVVAPLEMSDDEAAMVSQGVGMVLLAVAWGVVFGWLSRRFERQSDVVAAWACGEGDAADPESITHEGAAAFASALQRVAQLNAIPMGRHNWRHGSIQARVRYILSLASTGGTRRDIDRAVRRIKLTLWIAATGAVLLTGLDMLLTAEC